MINSPNSNCRVMWSRKIVLLLNPSKTNKYHPGAPAFPPFHRSKVAMEYVQKVTECTKLSSLCRLIRAVASCTSKESDMHRRSGRFEKYVMPGKRPKSEYWYQYLMASKRTPRLSHQVPLRIRVQSLESSGDILSGSCWPNIQNSNQLLASICEPIWFTWWHDVCEWISPQKKQRIYKHLSYIDSQKREKQLYIYNLQTVRSLKLEMSWKNVQASEMVCTGAKALHAWVVFFCVSEQSSLTSVQ